MSRFFRYLRLGLISLTLVAILAACGQGGTEVGNPNLPGGGEVPEAEPTFASPSPTPDESLLTTTPEEAPEEEI